jgi:putative membrane protein
MARLLSLIVTIPLLAVGVSFVLSNRELVPLGLWPVPETVAVPVWAVGLVLMLAGFLLGLVVSWLSHHRTRSARGRAERRVGALEAELSAAERRAAEAEKRVAELTRPAGPPPGSVSSPALAAGGAPGASVPARVYAAR